MNNIQPTESRIAPRYNLRHSPNRRYASGVGMVEVLVAMIVLAIGMLGTATLYTTALQAKTTAKSRMYAVNLVNDIADRIRSNRLAGDSYDLGALEATTAPTSTTNCIQSTMAAIACTPAQMAAADLHEWHQQINEHLPGAPGRSILVTPIAGTNQSTYLITVSWTEADTGTLNRLMHVLTVRI